MLDKLKGSKKNDKDTPPDLRKGGEEKESSDVGGKIKDLVGKMSGNKGEKKGLSASAGGPKKEPKKMPRPMPKPRIKPKPVDKAKLKPRTTSPPPKKPGGGLGGGFGRKIPDDDQKTLIGAAVFGIILIILVASGYYFLVYAPYQETLDGAKNTKIAEVDAYYKGSLAVDPQRQTLLDEINNAVTPEEVLAIDVIGPATQSWRTYQNQQINTKKDRFNRVMIVYSTDTQAANTSDQTTPSQKNVILKVVEAQKFVNQSDATVLANMEIQTPDTVAVPIMISRLQAAGGLISVGNSVDVYLKTTASESTGNNTTEQQTTTTQSNTPDISGATVLAILRAKDSGTIDASLINTQSYTLNSLTSKSERSQSSSTDIEQLLRAAASGGFNEAETRALLQNYGIKLSDYERTSNLGELDAQYLVLLEVPREDVLFLIQNMDSVMLTVPTQQAPTWMIQELQKIYG